MSNFTITQLQKNDYYNGFLQLLEQLTTVNSNEISYDDFSKYIDKIKSKVFIIKNDSNDKIIATATALIENKFIHKLSSVCHIEDVVIDVEHRNNGLGKKMINHCVEYAKSKGCYKIILNCSEKNVQFYEKCGFTTKNVEMSLYI